MFNKDIKKMIKESFSNETPNSLKQIKSKCENTKQKDVIEYYERKKGFSNLIFKRLAFVVLAVILFVGGICVGKIDLTNDVLLRSSSIFLDVNPSIEIQIDENDIVVDCIANNEDALIILDKISLKGVEVDIALYAIVGSMYANGYLTKERNSILVSVENGDDVTIKLEDIVRNIEDIFQNNADMECSIIGQEISFNEGLVEKASQYNISVGKMRLIEKIIDQCSLFEENNIEELVKMSIHELNLLYQSNDKDVNGDYEHEYVTGQPGGFKDTNDMLDYICESLGITKDSIDKYKIYTAYHHNHEFKNEIIYIIKIKLKDDPRNYEYIFNSITGEVLSQDALEDWKDKFDDDFEDHFDEREYREYIDKFQKEIHRLEELIKSPNLSEQELKILENKYEELIEELEDLMEEYDEFMKDGRH